MSETATKEKVTYVGVCTTLEEKKGGWYRIHIAVPGKQYPVKPETKRENLITKARELRDSGVVATWIVEEWPSENVNPNSGQPYTERRLDAVEEGTPAGQTQTGTAGGSQPEAHHDPIHFADKDRAMTRMNCIRNASMLWQGLALEGNDPDGYDIPLEVMKAALRYEKWIYRDIDPVPSSSQQAATQEPAANTGGRDNADEPDPRDDYDPPPVDDDIPF